MLHQPLPHYSISLVEREPKRMLDFLQAAHAEIVAEAHPKLLEKLSPAERYIQAFVDALTQSEGAWYRPIHNVIVNLAMIKILRDENAPRDLLFAAQLHDAGYSVLNIPGTLQGAAWEGKDKRIAHMQVGAELARKELYAMGERGLQTLPQDRIEKICECIAVHDNPYLGIDITDPEAQLLRDADRTFVISGISFWKDFLSYASDPIYAERYTQQGIELTPRNFLEVRLASFSTRESELPFTWDKDSFALKPALACLNEGGKPEVMHTKSAQAIVNQMFLRRAQEVSWLEKCLKLDDFTKMLADSLKAEMQAI